MKGNHHRSTAPVSGNGRSFDTNSVIRFDGTTGTLIGTFASGGGLTNPFDVAFGPDGNLYVSSLGSNEVIRFDGATGALIGTFASGPELNSPFGVAFTPHAVPEPSIVAMLGTGALVLLMRRRRARGRSEAEPTSAIRRVGTAT